MAEDNTLSYSYAQQGNLDLHGQNPTELTGGRATTTSSGNSRHLCQEDLVLPVGKPQLRSLGEETLSPPSGDPLITLSRSHDLIVVDTLPRSPGRPRPCCW